VVEFLGPGVLKPWADRTVAWSFEAGPWPQIVAVTGEASWSHSRRIVPRVSCIHVVTVDFLKHLPSVYPVGGDPKDRIVRHYCLNCPRPYDLAVKLYFHVLPDGTLPVRLQMQAHPGSYPPAVEYVRSQLLNSVKASITLRWLTIRLIFRCLTADFPALSSHPGPCSSLLWALGG